jgi:dihydrolipoamide dehydrogenase
MELCILGSGPGGYVAAIKAAQLGAKVTVIEEDEVGGTCLNYGCIPTKTLLASTEALSMAKNIASYGINFVGEVTPNMQKIIDRKNSVVSTQVKGIRGLFKSWGITLKEGRGTFISENQIKITSKNGLEEIITADKFIIATGSRPANIPIFPFDGKRIISSADALNLTEIPKSMLIVGAGVIGCEFACIYKELGSEVNIVEMMPRAIATEDTEVSALLEKELKKKKIKLHTDVKVEKVDVDENGVHASLSNGKTLSAEIALVSIGRAFNTDNIGLDKAGIKIAPRGFIIVDKFLVTSNPNVYAIGDVSGGMLLAHVASKEGLVAAKNIMGAAIVMDHSVVPAAIFTSPEIASVGLRQHQAEEQGIKFHVGHFQYRGLGKAHAMGEITGFFKVISDAATDKILGVHIVGAHAADIIHEAAVAMKNGITVKELADTIHAHPTLAEGLMEASEDVHGEAVHVPKK